MELIKNILSSDVGSATFIFSVLGLCFWIVYWVTRKVTQIETNHKILTNVNNKLESNIDEIRRDLSFIKGSYDIIKFSNSNQLMQSHSPISLTNEEVAKELGVEDMLIRSWENISNILDANVIGKNPYDIQQYCIEAVSVEPDKFFIKTDLDKIKQYAYANGQPLDLYTRMIAILIRDKYFNEKNINPLDVDKYANPV